jgi:hypothetical protein
VLSVGLVLRLFLEVILNKTSKGVVTVFLDFATDNTDNLSDFVRSDETSTVAFFAWFSTFVEFLTDTFEASDFLLKFLLLLLLNRFFLFRFMSCHNMDGFDEVFLIRRTRSNWFLGNHFDDRLDNLIFH